MKTINYILTPAVKCWHFVFKKKKKVQKSVSLNQGNVGKGQEGRGRGNKKIRAQGKGGRSGLRTTAGTWSLVLMFVSMGLHEEWSVDLWSPFRLDQEGMVPL